MQTRYFVFIHRPGPNWRRGRPISEQPLSGHFRYMSELASSNLLVLGGGFLDDSGAMGVLVADDIAAAEGIVAQDPAVADEIVTASVHPWFVTVGGQVELSEP